MADPLTVDQIIESLNQEATGRRKRKEYFKEWKNNRYPEAGCIFACEAGEGGTEILVYHGLQMRIGVNELGFLGGIAAGTVFAFLHNYLHGRKHKQRISIRDTVRFALTT